MAGHDIIVIGTSAGGVEALTTLVGTLPSGLSAAVFIVLHIPAHGTSLLPNILNRSGPLLALQATDGATIEHGRIYVAPPDQHMLVEPGQVRIVRGPKENRHRPAIDPLLRSAARAYGPRVVGVILTGALDDGTSGLLAVKQRGGVAIVQDPNEALYSSMPLHALEHVAVDYTLPLLSIGPKLVQLAHEPAADEEKYPMPKDMELETQLVEMDMDRQNHDHHPGHPSAYSCPDCGGVLWEIHDGDLLRFRCRLDHAYSLESMLAGQSEALEDALWVALKTLDESASLSRRMADRAYKRGQRWLAMRFEQKLREAEHNAALIRQVLMKSATIARAEPDAEIHSNQTVMGNEG